MLFVTAPHVGALDDIAATVRKLLQPATLLAATAVSVIGGEREVEEQAAVSLWAGNVGGIPTPVRLEAHSTPDGVTIEGLPAEAAAGERTLVLLADPFALPVVGVVVAGAATHPQLRGVGGVASCRQGVREGTGSCSTAAC